MAREFDKMVKSFDSKEVDWNEYESYRPPYTKALYDLLLQHHKDHAGQYNVALDVGAGGGTMTKVLLKYFQHVIWSDASADYTSRAQQRFRKDADLGSMTFLQKKFDEFQPELDFPDGQLVDMITAGTCIHFGDPARITTQLGSLVRSGGTLAAVSYGSMPILPPGDPAGPVAKRCKDKMLRWIDQNVSSFNGAEAPQTCAARYDNIDFDPTIWKDVRRITNLPHEDSWPEWIRPAASRVRETESFEIVSDQLIAKEVNYEFFPKHFHIFIPYLPLLDQIKEELEELKIAMGDRTVLVKWRVVIVLATKR